MVSVIVPNYNHGQYLQERLESIINQSYANFEIIILDDCSTDNSKAIIAKYQSHPKVRNVIFNTVNSGSVFKQWKKGIESANGDYIWIAESDDAASPDFLEKMVPPISQCDAALIFCDSYRIDENSKISKVEFTKPTPLSDTFFTVFDGNFFLKNFMLFTNSIYNASSVLFSKKKALTILGYEDYQLCGDWYFWSNMIKDSKLIFLNEKLNYFRKHSQEVSFIASKYGLDFIEGLDITALLIKFLHISFLNKFDLGAQVLHRINTTKIIISDRIRAACIKKWKTVFHFPILSMIYGMKLSPLRIVLYFYFRLKKVGFSRSVSYYLNKYFYKINGKKILSAAKN
jgi:glycosyltransferase involved in cell wall biosynthesis